MLANTVIKHSQLIKQLILVSERDTEKKAIAMQK